MNKLSYNILVVEDEQQSRENFVSYLSMFYENVFEAGNGEKALEIYNKEQVDIILLDINIPKISGLEVARQIREKDFKTKIIILSAHSEKTFLLEAMGLKLTKYLFKPVNRKDLKDSLDLAISELNKFDVVSIDDIKIKQLYTYSFSTKLLQYNDVELNLTKNEQIFFEYLLKNRNKVCSYDELLYYTNITTVDALKNLVKRLKKKFEEDLILNITGVGYKISV
ncbi:response regulator transcription factor [Arcobacter vandammei]|uniref:response regulator transcription factor n=1 Tax=Arcobacter vandammei TaxID=2782243 RepID=UPI0018DF5E96|nr:response regulator transcription factor [Arcobacter vandammei]